MLADHIVERVERESIYNMAREADLANYGPDVLAPRLLGDFNCAKGKRVTESVMLVLL